MFELRRYLQLLKKVNHFETLLADGFQASRFTKPLLWLIPIATGFVLILYAAVRRATLNYFKPTKMNLEIAGLQMYPTRWSTGGK